MMLSVVLAVILAIFAEAIPAPSSKEDVLNRMKILQATLEHQQSEITQQEQLLLAREQQIISLKSQLETGKMLERQNDRSPILPSLLQSIRHTGSTQAFFVALAGTAIDVAPNTIITFEDIKYDPAGNYNPSTGSYIIPVTGIYVFTFTVHIPNLDYGALDMITQNWAAATSYARDQNNAMCTVVFHFSQGQTVFVRYSHGSGAIYGGGYSHFGGFLLQASSG